MTIELEAWSSEVVELTAEQAALVAGTGLATVHPSRRPGDWLVVCDSHVGVVADGGWELRVVPRLRIPQLMFLLAYATDPAGWNDPLASFAEDEDLLSAVASGFAAQAERALARGVVRGYVTVDEQAAMLRGRLRVPDQLARHPGLPLPLELTHDDYSVDVPENRLLRGAATLLLRLPRVTASARERLRRVAATLSEARSAAPGPATTAPRITRLNAHYAGALALAERILRGTSIATGRGGIASATFVFDMNKVFEDFLSAALRDALEPHGGRVRTQRQTRLHLDEDERLRLVPDITWWPGDACGAVIDAKYKRLAGATPNDDVYQMLAYCTALRLTRGWLVFAAGTGERPRQFRVRHTEIEVVVTVVDVEQPPAAVLAQVDALARRIAAEAPAVVSRRARRRPGAAPRRSG